MPAERPNPFASRAGEKLAAALDRFALDPAGWICADLGSNVGGFVDCLLQRGAERVYAVDTAYGELAWKLRKHPRVVVRERTNALHVTLPEEVQLVTIDVGWTRQRHILPSAVKLLGPGGRILSLVKPHYEAPPAWLRRGVLPDEKVAVVVDTVAASLKGLGVELLDQAASPLPGRAGNREVWFSLRPLPDAVQSRS